MAFKDLFKRKNKEEQKEMTTEEQIKKAEQDIREKGADEQTEKDRIDESVVAQERKEGDEDSQDAKDRVDESEGTKRADEKRDGEEDEDREERHAARLEEAISRALAPLLERIEKLERSPREVEKGTADKLSALANRFEN